MSRCKHAMKRQQKFNKTTTLLIALISLFVIVSSSTLAILVTKTNFIKNTFNYSNVACEVIESEFINGKSVEKSNVCVKNTGDTESYIRAAIIVTWKDPYGYVYAKAPKDGVDYEIVINETNWFEKDGFYYYSKPVKPSNKTDNLIDRCSVKGSGLEGYGLSVEILASGIQSKPSKAVKDSWNVSVNSNGTISK